MEQETVDIPPEPIIPEAPKKKKQVIPTLIFLTLLSITGFFIYSSSSSGLALLSPKPTPTITPSPLPSPTTDPFAGWKIFSSTDPILSFKYPPEWIPAENSAAVSMFRTNLGGTFTVTYLRKVPNIAQWVRQNNAGQIGVSKFINNHNYLITHNETPPGSRSYILNMSNDNYFRFTIEPVPADPDGVKKIDLLSNRISAMNGGAFAPMS